EMLGALPDGLSSQGESARALLETWQGNYLAAPDAAAPLIFQAWYRALGTTLFEQDLSPEVFARLMKNNYVLNHAIDRLLVRDHDGAWWRGERATVLQRALERAIAEIAAVQGEDTATWRLDRMHAVRLEHELGKAVPQLGWFLNAPPAPWGGSTSTV